MNKDDLKFYNLIKDSIDMTPGNTVSEHYDGPNTAQYMWWKKQITEFLRESNAIEGVYNDYSLEQAWHAFEYLMSKKKMSPSVILKTHKILMLNKKDLKPDQIGYFRKIPVYIGGREGIKQEWIKNAIKDWCENMNMTKLEYRNDLEQTSKMLHVDYEQIHPFVDGNGRTGRMFMNWWRLRNSLPLLIIHEGKEQMEYYGWFK